MAFENLKSTGIKYLLGKLKTFLSDTYVKIADSVRSVNDVLPDANGNIKIDTVQYAQNLESESSQRNVETFVQRTTGGSSPVENGDGWLMLLKGNRVHDDYVPESIAMTVTPAEREEGEEPITATIDRDTFVAYVDESGTTNLVYSTQWSADPTLYGITVEGTPVAGDMISVVYVKEERGTITVAEPSKFVSTGWNLYDNVAGYAKVVKYEYGYMITGTYTSAKYAATPTGTQVDITITDGAFNIPDDGYIIVTGGNGTDTAIFPYWTDWTDGYDGEFAIYSKNEIDLSGLFGEGKPFPYGLCKVGDVADEIDLNIGVATSRIDRMDYSAENLVTAQASGRAYEYDEDYIYIVRASTVVTSISVDGSVSCDDHGLEYFTDTEVPVYTELLYGNNLKNKLEMNVLTISQQSLTSGQKSQVKSNLGFANQSDLDKLITAHNFGQYTSLATFKSDLLAFMQDVPIYESRCIQFVFTQNVDVFKGWSTFAGYAHCVSKNANSLYFECNVASNNGENIIIGYSNGTWHIESLNGNSIADLTQSGDYSTYINTKYVANVMRMGSVYALRCSVELKAHNATNTWVEIFTIPSGYEGQNIGKNTITTGGKTMQMRVDGNKAYINLLQSVTAGDLLSDQLIYLKS